MALGSWRAWLHEFWNDDQNQFDQPLSYVEAVERARREWAAARAYFETVSEPELVDHAIHLMDAAERKFVYLLRAAREAGVVAGPTRQAGSSTTRDIRCAFRA